MKKIIKLVFVLGCLLGLAVPVQAIPTLQLDFLGRNFDSELESVIDIDYISNGTYNDSAALVPQQERDISDVLIPSNGTGMYHITPIHLYDSKLRDRRSDDVVHSRMIGGDRRFTHPVPEPGTLMLLGTGLILVAGIGRKFFKAKS